jgi:ABC-type dipeptide/oligopeptide/nickel transport system permease component
MIRFILSRLLQIFIAFLGIIIMVFLLLRISGDPAKFMVSPMSTPDRLELLHKQMGLDKSVPEQFWIFTKGIFRGDFGDSYVKGIPVTEMLGHALPNTLKLTVPTFVIGFILSIALGVLAASKRDSIFDNGIKFIAVLGQALPGFWVGIMAMLIFSLYWKILPTGQQGGLDHYILPVGTMMFFMLPGMMRLVRSSMLDVLDSEYIKLARIKGLPEAKVIWKHALRNAIISPLTVAGMIVAGLVTGAIITENIFIWPGMGRLIMEATFARDFPVAQAVAVIVAAMVLGCNFLVDVAYAWIDPQIKYEKS